METRERWHQLWGTCSVKDHKRPGAFVAEVLYDKLLIPVPPTVEDGVRAEDEECERERWSKYWEPERQKRMLEILGDLADPIPWTAERQAEWQDDAVISIGKYATEEGCEANNEKQRLGQQAQPVTQRQATDDRDRSSRPPREAPLA